MPATQPLSSGSGDESILLDFCLRNQHRVIPDPLTGHHWYAYETIAVITGTAERTIRTKSEGLPRHPRFQGFVRLVDFSRKL